MLPTLSEVEQLFWEGNCNKKSLVTIVDGCVTADALFYGTVEIKKMFQYSVL
jgi:hypothetical protein